MSALVASRLPFDERGGLVVLVDPGRTTSDHTFALAARSADAGACGFLIGDSLGRGGDVAIHIDAIRERLKTGVPALGATFDDGKSTLLAVVTDDVRDRGVRADAVIKELAAAAGGRGGGKPHMAQAGIPDASRIPEALGRLPDIVRGLLGAA